MSGAAWEAQAAQAGVAKGAGIARSAKPHADLPALVQSMQPKIGNLAKAALGFVAGIGGGLLRFLASLAVAGIMMAFGEGGARAIRSIFERVADGNRGGEFVDLSTATIRAVAKGVLGVAFLQAIIVGLCLLVAGVPWAGVLAVIVLVLGIAQVPALIVTLPAIGYLWASGNYGTGAAVLYTLLLGVAGLADNVLKPLMLGRGVDAPMPVILLGALGGMAAGGILGMFVGGTLPRARLPDLHGMGRDESRRASSTSGRRSVPGRLNRCRLPTRCRGGEHRRSRRGSIRLAVSASSERTCRDADGVVPSTK